MRERILPLLFGAGLMTLTGCATTETVLIDLGAPGPSADVKAGKAESLRVTVVPLEDVRPDNSRLGIRTHFWTSSVTYFKGVGVPLSRTQPNAPIIDTYTKFVVDYLTQKGWQAEAGRRDGAGPGGADVILSAKVLIGDGDATSWLFKTDIAVKAKVAIQALNTADGSMVRMTLNGQGTQRVFWFETEDMRDLIRDVLAQSLDQFLAATKVDNKLLRLK